MVTQCENVSPTRQSHGIWMNIAPRYRLCNVYLLKDRPVLRRGVWQTRYSCGETLHVVSNFAHKTKEHPQTVATC